MGLEWWHWLVLGLVLVALELAASGGFYVIFFGIAALAIGALRLLDLAGPPWMQILLFILISVGALLFFRRPMLRWLQLDAAAGDVDSLVGETATALDEIQPGGIGRAELRGTVWTARNRAAVALRKGQRCTVVSVDRLTIFLEPEGVRL
ncbi:MAG TPA: NfeD family protein [Vicinamibacterales bacterium]|nr:NfeD family protein [Vicinamibacterales bacterium]